MKLKYADKIYTVVKVVYDKDKKIYGYELSWDETGHVCKECGRFHPDIPSFIPANSCEIIKKVRNK